LQAGNTRIQSEKEKHRKELKPMKYLQKENVQILEHSADWKEAIRSSVGLLEKGNYVTQSYKEAVIDNVTNLGPYICIAPHVAMPHARPEQGALATQIAITLFREEVVFTREDARANLFIALSAADSDSHLELLAKISELLQMRAVPAGYHHACAEPFTSEICFIG